MPGSSRLAVSLPSFTKQYAFNRPTSRQQLLTTGLDVFRSLLLVLFILRFTKKTLLQLRGYGLVGSLQQFYKAVYKRLYGLFLKLPFVQAKVRADVDKAILELEAKLVPSGPGVTKYTALPATGWSADAVREELKKLEEMKHTRWEDGRVSGAVYHGGDELSDLQGEAFRKFGVSNPIHPDVFPAVRKMEAEVVAMTLSLFNAPDTGAGVTTSGGTESILMAVLAARQKAFHERGVRVFEPQSVRETCRCSRDRIMAMMRNFSPEDRRDMVGEDGRIGVTCEFCSRHYDLDPADVEAEVLRLVEELDVRLAMIAPEIVGDPKRSLFRIHRDTRFSNDKRPYKTSVAAWLFHADAGRGVGMEAVATNIARLKGEIDIHTEPGRGTRFTLSLPLTLIVTETLMLQVAEQRLAVPADAVRGLRYVLASEITVQGGHKQLVFDGRATDYYSLRELLGYPAVDAATVQVALLETGSTRLAVGVDAFLELEESVVRGLEAPLKALTHLAGAAVSSTGEVALVLDPAGLHRLTAGAGPEGVQAVQVPLAAPAPQHHLLLVDDSVSVRKVVAKLLARAGYRVTTAADGVEATERLRAETFDALLTDLEMPRMSGYELLEEVRARPATAQLPIVVMTSRAGEKHMQLAFELGATDYLTKPVDETKLLAFLARTVAARGTPARP